MKNQKLSNRGFTHGLLMVAVVAVFAVAGVFYVVATHAATRAVPSAELAETPQLGPDEYFADDGPKVRSGAQLRRVADGPPKEAKPGSDRPKAALAVRISKSQLGIGEHPPGSNCTKYDRKCEFWCVAYLTWVWRKAGVNVPHLINTAQVHKWGDDNGLLHSLAADPNYQPKPGDAVLFGREHTGMVSSVEGNKIRIISGNWGDKVARQPSNNGKGLDYISAFGVKEKGANGATKITAFVSPKEH